MGATDEQITALGRSDLGEFAPAWRAAFQVAEEMTRQGGRIAPETYARLAGSWTEAQVVEIVAVIGVFNYFNRFANALEIPPTK